MRQGGHGHRRSRSGERPTSERPEAGPIDPLIVLAAVLTLAAAVFGGASRENPLRLATVEIAALPLLALAIRRLALGQAAVSAGQARGPVGLLLFAVILPLAQIIPLPPALWTALPGSAPRLEALRLLGDPTAWAPLSLAPDQTWRCALALIPPSAMFLGILATGESPARRLAVLWIVLASAGLILGVAQIATPAGGLAWPYRTSNFGSLVGLFANRNHEAGFLLALAPIAAALAAPGLAPRHARRRREAASAVGPGPWLAGLFIVVSVVALGVIRSRAGVLLAGPAVLGAMLVLTLGDGGGRPRGAKGRRRALLLAGAVGLAAVAVAVFGLSPILDRFAPQESAELRFEAWPHVIAAARAHQPLGAGLGSFDRVFEAAEPLGLVAPTYFNHAHNEYLELWLEAGWPGLALIGAFLAWFALAAARAWRSGTALARGASVALLLLLIQSLVDYPLRTETLAVFAAFCCAVLAIRPADAT